MKKNWILFLIIISHHFFNFSQNPFNVAIKPFLAPLDTFLPTCSQTPQLKFIKSRNTESMSLEEDFFKMLAQSFQADNFVETGTYLGGTTALASNYFSHIHSIELSDELFTNAKKRFENNQKIHLYKGDSAALLPVLIPKLKGKTIFFLDAHFSLGVTAKGSTNTPIITELQHIQKSMLKNAIIIIDDIRMFYEPLINVTDTFAHDYPTLEQVVEKIIAINPNYCIAVIYDCLIAYPKEEKITVSNTVRAATLSRLATNMACTEKDIFIAELLIAHAGPQECEAITCLVQHCMENWSKNIGFSRHYALWYGLICMVQEKYGEAYAYFQEAKIRGINHWRIDWYMEMAKANCFFAIK